MIRKLNRTLRALIFLAGGLFVLMTLIARTECNEDDNDGFQQKEFDDIW